MPFQISQTYWLLLVMVLGSSIFFLMSAMELGSLILFLVGCSYKSIFYFLLGRRSDSECFVVRRLQMVYGSQLFKENKLLAFVFLSEFTSKFLLFKSFTWT